jgi:hypothetical protein
VNQSTLLTGALLAAFLLFLAAKNRLVTYANVLWGSQPSGAAAAAAKPATSAGAPPAPAASTSTSAATPSGQPAASNTSTSSASGLSANATALLKNAFTQMGNGSATQDIPWADTAESVGLSLLGGF